MIQVIFFALLVVTLLGGFFAYYAPSQKTVSPVKFMMDNTGYNSTETTNRKRSEQINMVTSKGLLQIRRQMDDLAVEQNKFLNVIQDQQHILQSANKDAYNIMLAAKNQGTKGNKDILQLEALTSEMQDDQRLLVARGQDLVSLNNQLTRNRQLVAEQVDFANINTASSLQALQQHYAALNNQASGFFDQVTQHNQQVQDHIDKIQDKLREMADNATYTRQEHEDMMKLAYNEQRCKDLAQDAEQNFLNSKEQLNDQQEKTQDLIEEDRQKEEDQRSIMQQRIADQEQRIQDQKAQ